MNGDPKRIIVTECVCNGCNVHAIRAYHEYVPELQVEGGSASEAAGYLAERLAFALDVVSDDAHRDMMRVALDDARAFLNWTGTVNFAREAVGPGPR